MSDTFYGLECLARERARAVERAVRRPRRLTPARGRHRRRSFGKHFKDVVEEVLRFGRILPWRTKSVPGCGVGPCRR